MLYATSILALLGAALLVIGYRFASLLLRPPRQPVTRTPDEHGLDYEDIAFLSKEGLQLKGWWIPAASERDPGRTDPAPVVLLLHPMFGNRAGASARSPRQGSANSRSLDLLKVACDFWSAGFGVMLFDFRGHGESQHGPCAGGYNEDQDVVGAVDYAFRRIAREAPGIPPRVGVVGFGLGASAAITAIGRVRGDGRTIRVFSADSEGSSGFLEFQAENIKLLSFLVAVEPASQRTLLNEQLREVFPPLSPLLVPIVDRFCRFESGYPLDGRLLLQFADQVYTPALFVQRCAVQPNRGDEVQQLYQAVPGPKQTWQIEGMPDRLAVYDYVARHPQRAIAFGQQQRERQLPAGPTSG